uniref:Uncharacterized protein n=1 Tax=Cannabis sativa TaxID=3483 RepID=A0A803NFX8_CANSA
MYIAHVLGSGAAGRFWLVAPGAFAPWSDERLPSLSLSLRSSSLWSPTTVDDCLCLGLSSPRGWWSWVAPVSLLDGRRQWWVSLGILPSDFGDGKMRWSYSGENLNFGELLLFPFYQIFVFIGFLFRRPGSGAQWLVVSFRSIVDVEACRFSPGLDVVLVMFLNRYVGVSGWFTSISFLFVLLVSLSFLGGSCVFSGLICYGVVVIGPNLTLWTSGGISLWLVQI